MEIFSYFDIFSYFYNKDIYLGNNKLDFAALMFNVLLL